MQGIQNRTHTIQIWFDSTWTQLSVGIWTVTMHISLHHFDMDSSLVLKDGMEEGSYWDAMLGVGGLEGEGGDG